MEPGIEKYSVLRALKAINRADVVLLVLDAVDGVTARMRMWRAISWSNPRA